MADETYTNGVYMAQDANTLVITDSGSLLVETGGSIKANAGAVTLSSSAGTLNASTGLITTEALTTAAGAAETLTITNSLCAAADTILLTRNGGTSDEGTEIFSVVPGAGSFVITVENRHASAALDGTLIIGFLIIKAGT